MSKRQRTFIVLLFLASISFCGAIVSFNEISKVDLKKTETVIGAVEEAFITQRIIKGIKYNRTQTVFCFTLSNSTQNFTIHIPSGGYGNLERNIRKGDSIKVYYASSSDKFNMDVYQVETKTGTTFSFETYKEKASNQAGYILIGGILILMIALFGYMSFNILKFMTRLVQL